MCYKNNPADSVCVENTSLFKTYAYTNWAKPDDDLKSFQWQTFVMFCSADDWHICEDAVYLGQTVSAIILYTLQPCSFIETGTYTDC